MNQHSKRGGQANGNSVDEVRRGATRPAAVVAIVLCVGFAVAMVAIWSCGKPPSHQETQTQPEAAVQTETAKPETETSTPGLKSQHPRRRFHLSRCHLAPCRQRLRPLRPPAKPVLQLAS